MSKRLVLLVLPVLLALALAVPLLAASSAQLTFPTNGTVNATANIRSGPSTTNAVVGSAAPGQAVIIIACNTDCTWYQIGDAQWIAAFLIDATTTEAPTPAASPAVTVTNAVPITIIGWNVESGGALQNVVADRMGSFQDVDIWGLSEVREIDAESFEFGAEEGEGADYQSFLGTTGSADRLLLIWDSSRFTLVNSGQLLEIGQGARAPLWVQLRENTTGLEFIAMVNHLHRSNEGTRHRQAQMLNAWAASQSLPAIAMGDYNFDWNLPTGETDHDAGYDNMVVDSVWQWIRPAELVTTQCSGWPCSFTSVLDFFFVSGPAQDWNITSQIIVVEDDFPDDNTTPDHRPVMAAIASIDTVAAPAAIITTTIVLTPTAVSTTAPTVAPTATPTTVPTCPQANTTGNLRAGPSTGYAVVGSVQQGECIVITGRTEVGDWFQLSNGNWIAAFLVTNAGSMASIPVVSAPVATPTSIATGCDPSYPDICIQVGVPDLDCGEIPHRQFRVVGSDPHGFDGDGDGIGCEEDAAAPVPVAPVATPVPPTPVPQAPVQNCDSSYPGVCIPPYPPDLDCGEITFRRFQVVGSDPHGFDGDNDGIGCES